MSLWPAILRLGLIVFLTGEPPYGDVIIEGSIGDASNLLPPLASDSASFDIIGLVYNGIVKYDKDLKLVGDLAESWEISPDCRLITFHLRKGVKWHDGREFTAEDVLFGYKVMTNPKTPTAYASSYLEVERVKAPDPYTLNILYRKPFAPGLESWSTMVVLPHHLLQGKEITKSELSRKPIGTGPYQFAEWTPGEKIVLNANPDYFEGCPFLSRYVYRVIPDQATMFLELLSGGIDWAGLTPLQYQRQTSSSVFAERFTKYRYLDFSYSYLGFNLHDPRFSDRRIRQAISYAIDRQEIIDGVLLGMGTIATGPFKPDIWAYNPNVKRYPYDPNKALSLLSEAGWRRDGTDGILKKDGLPFAFTILTNQGNEQRRKAAEIIQKRLKDIGMQVKIRVIEWTVFLRDFVDKRNFEAILLGWTTGPEPDQYDIWHSSKTGERELNFISYKNPEVDRLLDLGRHTCEQEKRKVYYYRFQEIIAEDTPYVFLYVPEALPVINSRIKGIEPAPAGISYNFIHWHNPSGLRRCQ